MATPASPAYLSYHSGAPAVCSIISAEVNSADNADSAPTVFDLCSVPTVSIENYIMRLVHKLKVAPATTVVAFILVDRFASKVVLTKLNVHMVIAAAFRVASAQVNDSYDSFGRYARVCGMRKEALRRAIQRFLCTIEFALGISDTLFQQVKSRLVHYRPSSVAAQPS
eukprot:TRINITY_DN68431_c0_g1_i1.p1 TRINITY_DN68431_c0_g1~~TRINITY_DN68431_c0_g1_i1.p1  ORF type:complete len:192 (+),score=46.86 TRINITY_DN68431_c0_g1_i1:75-578(+)